jgi:hypothetical protein
MQRRTGAVKIRELGKWAVGQTASVRSSGQAQAPAVPSPGTTPDMGGSQEKVPNPPPPPSADLGSGVVGGRKHAARSSGLCRVGGGGAGKRGKDDEKGWIGWNSGGETATWDGKTVPLQTAVECLSALDSWLGGSHRARGARPVSTRSVSVSSTQPVAQLLLVYSCSMYVLVQYTAQRASSTLPVAPPQSQSLPVRVRSTPIQYYATSFHFTVRPGPRPSALLPKPVLRAGLGGNRQRTTASRRRTYEANFSCTI